MCHWMRMITPVIVLILAVAHAATGQVWDEERKQALVRFEVADRDPAKPHSVGTGVMVRGLQGRTYVLTSTHVLTPGVPSESIPAGCVHLPPGSQAREGSSGGAVLATGCVRHLGADISLVELKPRLNPPYKVLPVAAPDISEGQLLFLAGFPNGQDSPDTNRSGKVTSLVGLEPNLIVTDMLTAPGMSGGPYLWEGGAVVGFHVGGVKYIAGFAQMRPISAIRLMLEPYLGPLLSPSPGMAFSKCPIINNRTKIILYPYHGVGGVDTTVSYSDLETFLSEKMRNIGANFYNKPEAKYLANLCIEKSPNKPKTLAQFLEEWHKQNALLQMDGVITKNTLNSSESLAKSSIYFGDLSQILSNKAIQVIRTDLLLDASQYVTISDTHSAATLFSLAVHAKGDGLSSAYYLDLAGRAREILNTIKVEGRESQDIKELRCAVEHFLISNTTTHPIPMDCQ